MSNQDSGVTTLSVNGGPAMPVNPETMMPHHLDPLLAKGKGKKGAIPVELVGSKVYKSYEKEVGKDVAKELLEKTDDQLKMILAENILRRDDLKGKLAENKDYIKARDVVDTLEGGMKSTMKSSDAAAKLAKAVIKSRK